MTLLTTMRAIFPLLMFIILVQTACADLAIDVFSKVFSEWAVEQFGAVPVIVVGGVLLLFAIVWGVHVRNKRSKNKQ